MAWQRDGTSTAEIWPHRIASGAVLLTFGGRACRDDAIVKSTEGDNANNARWDLYGVLDEWSRLEFDVEIQVKPEELAETVFPPGTTPGVSLVLCARCNSTRWQEMCTAPLGTGRAEFHFRIPRDVLYKEIELRPCAVLSEPLTGVDASYATAEGIIIATGAPVCIWVDEPPDRPGRGLRIEWQEFGETFANALYRVDIERSEGEPEPVIYFNSRHPQLRGVIDYTGADRATKALRDAVYRLLAVQVWMDLAAYASHHSLDTDGDGEDTEELPNRILSLLSQKLGMAEHDITSALEDTMGRSDMCCRIQHWLNVAPALGGLVGILGGATPEDQD